MSKIPPVTLELDDVLVISSKYPYRVIDREVILINPPQKEVVHFDPIATWVVTQFDGKIPLRTVLARAVEHYDVDEPTLSEDVFELLNQLLADGFLERVSTQD